MNSCLPLINQYRLLAESGASAAAISAHLLEATAKAANGEAAETLNLLNETSFYMDEAKAYSSSLYSMLNTIDSLENDPYVSKNLTNVLQVIRNSSFCNTFFDSVTTSFCGYMADLPTVQFGIPALFKSSVEAFSVYRQQLANSPTLEFAVNLTVYSDMLTYDYYAIMTQVALDNVLAIYQSNFEEVAANVQQIFAYFLAASIVYYCLLMLVLLAPVLPWARREYTKVKEICTLLPVEVLASNPYINIALKGH